ncbi:MAG: MMPL family transporter [Planctomycetales bacterium]|nr:MMPL family transporter [Planctomycetales bacterium]
MNNRNWLLLATVVLLLGALPVANRLSFDQTIESFFPPANPDIQVLKKSRKDFGGDEFVIVAWHQPGLLQTNPEGEYLELTPEAEQRIKTLSAKLGELPGVDGERTRDLARFLQKTPRNRNTRRALLSLFDGILIGPDQETTAIVLQLYAGDSDNMARVDTIRAIRAVAREFDAKTSVAGEAVQIQDMFDLVERDGNLLYLASLGVLSFMLMIIFRSIRWVLVSVGIVITCVVCTRAILVLAGAQLSMVSSMLNSLVTIISISTTVHIIVYYRELRGTLNARDAAVQTLRELWHPVLWTVVTIAVGFAALLVSEIVPVRSFAIMMTLATLLVIVVTLAVLPAAFASGSNVPIPGRVRLEDQLDAVLNRMAHLIDRHPAGTAVVCLALTAITAPGLWMMQVETDFSKNFRESSPIVQSLRFVESSLGPAGTWDVAFDVPDPLTSEFLDQTKELTNVLKDLSTEDCQLDVLSLNDAIDVPPRLGNARARLQKIDQRQHDLVQSFYNSERRRMRIVLRSPEQQSTEAKLAQIQRVRDAIAAHFERTQTVASEATKQAEPPVASGLFVLMARIIDSLLEDQWKSFLWACFGTFACMAIAFRSVRIGLISLVPNVFPIALVTGSMGLLNVPVNIGTAMIASVSMGFTCSVHYIEVFQNALPKVGLSQALMIAQSSVGKAVVLAHFALVAGFMVLTASEFIPLVYFGALLSLSMIGGLISDLVLLPLLLRWTTPAREEMKQEISEV